MLKSFSPRSAVEITPAIPGMEPQGTYLVDILSALSGVNMKQAAALLSALEFLRTSGRLSREFPAADPQSLDFSERLRLSRAVMIDLLTGDTGEADKAQAVDIASRLANIYYTNGAYVDARAMRDALERMQAAA